MLAYGPGNDEFARKAKGAILSSLKLRGRRGGLNFLFKLGKGLISNTKTKQKQKKHFQT